MNRAIIGIDPGKTGYACMIDEDNQKQFYEFFDPRTAANFIQKCKNENEIIMIRLEKVWAFPGQGVTSMFSFGENFGTWQGIIAYSNLSYELITPVTWKKGLIVMKKGETSTMKKKKSILACNKLYPDVELVPEGCKIPNTNKADALLIAHTCKLIYL